MRTSTILSALGLGAIALYFLDRERGRARRAHARNAAINAWNESGKFLTQATKDLASRASGVVAELQRSPSIASSETREERSGMGHTNWAPGVRLLAGATGGAMAFYGLRNRDAAGAAVGLVGAGLVTRSVANKGARDLLGVGPGHGVFNIQKVIHIDAPVDEVWDFWTRYENFPRFMSHLREVNDLGNGRSHWVAVGPAGVPVEWDAEITDFEPKSRLGWRSVVGAMVANSGLIQFQEDSNGEVRVQIRISYRPPAGLVGHTVASLFGVDPKQAMDEDLNRLKSLIERGKTRKHGQDVLLSEIDATEKAVLNEPLPNPSGT